MSPDTPSVSSTYEVRLEDNEKLSVEELREWLGVLGETLPEPLGKSVDLGDYAEKLRRHAVLITGRQGALVAGLLAMYANDPHSSRAFISFLAIDVNHQGRGLGRWMVQLAMEKATEWGMRHLDLTALTDNVAALAFYQRLGFERKGLSGNKFVLTVAL